MANGVLQGLGIANEFLARERVILEQERKERNINDTISMVANRISKLPDTASEMDIMRAQYKSLNIAGKNNVGAETAPLISSIYGARAQQSTVLRDRAYEQRLGSELADITGLEKGMRPNDYLQIINAVSSSYKPAVKSDGQEVLRRYKMNRTSQNFELVPGSEITINAMTWKDKVRHQRAISGKSDYNPTQWVIPNGQYAGQPVFEGPNGDLSYQRVEDGKIIREPYVGPVTTASGRKGLNLDNARQLRKDALREGNAYASTLVNMVKNLKIKNADNVAYSKLVDDYMQQKPSGSGVSNISSVIKDDNDFARVYAAIVDEEGTATADEFANVYENYLAKKDEYDLAAGYIKEEVDRQLIEKGIKVPGSKNKGVTTKEAEKVVAGSGEQAFETVTNDIGKALTEETPLTPAIKALIAANSPVRKELVDETTWAKLPEETKMYIIKLVMEHTKKE